MNKNKIILFFCCIFAPVIVLSCSMHKEKQISNTDIGLRIGSGDDITGLLMKEIIKANKAIQIENVDIVGENEEVLHDFTFKDC